MASDNLKAIQGHFHRLITQRADGMVERHAIVLPDLTGLTATRQEPAWFSVLGMHGGFSYWLEGEGAELRLVTESWSRIVEGSGQRHEITAGGARLVEEGFV
jgi:hypothetical protein